MNDQQYYGFLDKLIPYPYPEHNVNMTFKQIREERARAALRGQKYGEFYKPENMSQQLSSSFEKDIKVSKEYEDAYNDYLNSQKQIVAEFKKFNKIGWLLFIPLILAIVFSLVIELFFEDLSESIYVFTTIILVALFVSIGIAVTKQSLKIRKLSYGSVDAIQSSQNIAKEIANVISSNGYVDAKEADICNYMKVTSEEVQYQNKLEKIARKKRAKKVFKSTLIILAISLLLIGTVLSIVFWDWVKENIVYPALAILIIILLFVGGRNKDDSNKSPGLISQIREERREKALLEEKKKQSIFYNNGGLDMCSRIPGLGEVVMSNDRRMINRIGNYEVDYSYSTGKINRIGPYEVTYQGDKIQFIGNLEVEYNGDSISRVIPR